MIRGFSQNVSVVIMMKTAQAKQHSISDRDIRNNSHISENNLHPLSVHQNQENTPVPKDKQKLLHDIENAFKGNLISKEVYIKTKEKLKSSMNEIPATSITEETKPKHFPPPEPKTAAFQKDNNPQTKQIQEPIKETLKPRVKSKSLYEKIKTKLIGKAHLSEPQETKTGPLPIEQPVISKEEPKEKVPLHHRNKKHFHRHLKKIESDVHDMSKTLRSAKTQKKSRKQIRKLHVLKAHADKMDAKACDSKKIKELRKKEHAFSDDIKSIDKLYKDDVISLESHEQNKKQIEKKIADIKDTILKTHEKEEIDNLEKRIENEIETTFSSGHFRIEHKKHREDIDALTKIYNIGLISNDEYLQKKEKLNTMLNKTDTILLGISSVFEEYKKELIAKIAENESSFERDTIFSKEVQLSSNPQTHEDPATQNSVSPKQESPTIIKKIKSALGITSKNTGNSHNPVLSEIRKNIIPTEENEKS